MFKLRILDLQHHPVCFLIKDAQLQCHFTVLYLHCTELYQKKKVYLKLCKYLLVASGSCDSIG